MLFVVDSSLDVPARLDRLEPEPVWLLNHPAVPSAALLEWTATLAQHFAVHVRDEDLERGIHRAIVDWQFIGPSCSADVPAPRHWRWLRTVL